MVHFHLHVLLAIKYMIRNLKHIGAKRFTIEKGTKGSKNISLGEGNRVSIMGGLGMGFNRM